MRRSETPRNIPPPLEVECLKALWQLGEGHVRDVQQALGPDRKLAYTTVMTVLERLVRKEAVARRKAGRAFVYSPLLSRETLRRLAVKQLTDSLFSGSEEELIAYLRRREPEPSPIPEASLDTALL
jgi:predicted transcriptional regulator